LVQVGFVGRAGGELPVDIDAVVPVGHAKIVDIIRECRAGNGVGGDFSESGILRGVRPAHGNEDLHTRRVGLGNEVRLQESRGGGYTSIIFIAVQIDKSVLDVGHEGHGDIRRGVDRGVPLAPIRVIRDQAEVALGLERTGPSENKRK
jgi:hypothetical protein